MALIAASVELLKSRRVIVTRSDPLEGGRGLRRLAAKVKTRPSGAGLPERSLETHAPDPTQKEGAHEGTTGSLVLNSGGRI